MVDMTWQEWDQVTKPKVNGAWNLHHALEDQPLDFFWLASSVITAVDQPGQGNYSASNTFLEAFCQYRLGLGLPTAVLGICPIKGVGFVAESAVAQRNTKAQGIYSLGESEYLGYVELSILAAMSKSPSASVPSILPPVAWKNDGQIVMGLRSELDLEDPNNRTNWRRDRRMGSYHNIRNKGSDENASDSNGLKLFLTRISEDVAALGEAGSVEFLAVEVGRKVYDFMLKPGEEDIDISLSLAQIGLDSLMATELRRWFRQVLGLQVSVLEIMGSGSLRQLAETVSASLAVKYSADASH
jgi:aryl carrier-like protein